MYLIFLKKMKIVNGTPRPPYTSQDHNYSMLEYAEENDSVLFKTDPNDCLNKPVSNASSVLK